MDALQKLSDATRALSEAKTLDDVKQIIDIAEAAKVYARAAKLGLEAQNHAAEVKLRAERKAGEMLKGMEKNKGSAGTMNGRTSSGGHTMRPPEENAPKLSDLGITKTQSSRWQKASELPEETFEQHVEETKSNGKELTSTGVQKIAQKVQKERKKQVVRNRPKPEPLPVSPRLFVGRAECLDMLADSTVDITITSPPYNLGDTTWPMGGEGRASRNGIDYASHDDGLEQDLYEQWQINVLRELYRVSKPGASLFYNHKTRTLDGTLIHPMRWLLHPANPWTVRQEIIWDRTSTHNHSAQLFWPEDERIYWMTKGKPNLPDRPIGMSSVWRFHGPKPETWHPAPFVDELPRRCLAAISVPGQTVLDPFAGSCTTCKVALEMGCIPIGVDCHKEYLVRAAEENGWDEPSDT